MIVFGTLKSAKPNESGNVLFDGTLEDCQKYAANLDKGDYESLNICADNGIIKERLLPTSQEI
jgi:hypothetical protein